MKINHYKYTTGSRETKRPDNTISASHSNTYEIYKVSLAPGEKAMSEKEFVLREQELALSKQLGNMIF